DISQWSNHDAALARFADDSVSDSLFHGVICPACFVLDQFNADHIAPLAHVADVRQWPKFFVQPVTQISDPRLHLLQDVFSLEQLQIGRCDSATKRVACVSM